MDPASAPLTPHSLPPTGLAKAAPRSSRSRKGPGEIAMYSTAPTGGVSRKSMGILAELQKYMTHVESLAGHRKLEIEKLHDEKRDLEKLLRLPTDRRILKAPTLGELRGDEPSQVKFLLEDIRVLKDRVRKYKERWQSGDRQVSAQTHQILKLQDRVAALEGSLQSANRTEDQISVEQRLQEEMVMKDKEIRDLKDRVAVAQRSREADARRHKSEAQEVRKEAAGFKKEVSRLSAELEERNKEIRMDAMKIRSLRKKLDPIKRQLNQATNPNQDSPSASMNGPLPSLTDGDFSLASPGFDFSASATPRETGLETGLEAPVTLTPRSMAVELKRLRQVCQAQQAKLARLGLAGSLDGSETGLKRQIAPEEAAVKIQTALRGYAERKNFVRQRSAALRIQAQLRGHQVRKKLRQTLSLNRVPFEGLTAKPELNLEVPNGGSAGEGEGLRSEDSDGGDRFEGNPVNDIPPDGVSPAPSPTKDVLKLRQPSGTAKSGAKSPGPRTAGRDSPKGSLKKVPSSNGRNSPTVRKAADAHSSSPSPRPTRPSKA